MAETKSEAGRTFSRALGYVRGPTRGGTDVQLAQALWAAGGHGPDAVYADMYNAIRRARAAFREAQDIQNTPGYRSSAALIPNNRGIYASQPRYEYRVVSVNSNPSTGYQREIMVVVRSNSRLDSGEILLRAGRLIGNSQNFPQYQRRFVMLGPNFTSTFHLISASQYLH